MVTLDTSSGVQVCGLMLACNGEGDYCPRAFGGIWMSVLSRANRFVQISRRMWILARPRKIFPPARMRWARVQGG